MVYWSQLERQISDHISSFRLLPAESPQACLGPSEAEACQGQPVRGGASLASWVPGAAPRQGIRDKRILLYWNEDGGDDSWGSSLVGGVRKEPCW